MFAYGRELVFCPIHLITLNDCRLILHPNMFSPTIKCTSYYSIARIHEENTICDEYHAHWKLILIHNI